jgi:hypothetical protein
MWIVPPPASSPSFSLAPVWRLCLVVLCLSAAIYLPLMVSEPRRIDEAAEGNSATLKASLPSSRVRSTSAKVEIMPVRNKSAMALLTQ